MRATISNGRGPVGDVTITPPAPIHGGLFWPIFQKLFSPLRFLDCRHSMALLAAIAVLVGLIWLAVFLRFGGLLAAASAVVVLGVCCG